VLDQRSHAKESSGKSLCRATLACMAKLLPDKKAPEKRAPAEVRVLPMDLKLEDLLADERSDWQVIGNPYTTAAGKTAHERVESVKQPGLTEIRAPMSGRREANMSQRIRRT
jgi:hypothetical protein